MKRSKIKIGKMTERMSEERVAHEKVKQIAAVLLILSLTACEKAWYGRDGRAGDAFIALTWQEVEPSYIDAGTGAVPQVFYWGEYYEIRPGNYSLYYEGSVWTGTMWANYGWEVFYEIWEISGEKGDWYYNGENGPDNFFTIECNPYGPYLENSYKSSEMKVDFEVLSEEVDEIIILKKAEGMEFKITYIKKLPTQLK